MSILIRGMEMPKNCMLCPFCVEEADPANGEMCMVTGKLMPPCNRERLDDCPLVPVPPHGDLIDRDAILKAYGLSTSKVDCSGCKYKNEVRCEKYELCEALNDAPTIIEAEEGE